MLQIKTRVGGGVFFATDQGAVDALEPLVRG
jgi:hypothetical protein